MTALERDRQDEVTSPLVGGVRAPRKVLVVDDVRANLKLVEALLEPLDCEVVLAGSADEALELLRDHEFAVLLLDVHMPDVDGYALADRIRKRAETRDVPIIFLTSSHPDEEDKELRGYDSGAVDFLFKPLDGMILCSKVRVFLDLYESKRHVTEAKSALERAYEELKVTQAQLVQSAKMAALGQLVAGIAHEINNPLAFVVSHLGTARRSLDQVDSHWAATRPDAAHEAWTRANVRLKEMHAGLERIRDLVHKLRTFSRLDEGDYKYVSVRECVESVLMILNHRLSDRIVVHAEYGEPEYVECYPALLSQAVMNLVANSIDSITGPGEIALHTGERDGAYHIVVRDTGSGIPIELRERVFDPFFTTKDVGEGVGLGLSVSYSIVQKHGGTLRLECPEDGGTSATIVLPLERRG
jgi:two-component system NtrC family sensor kinase